MVDDFVAGPIHIQQLDTQDVFDMATDEPVSKILCVFISGTKDRKSNI